MDFLKSWPHKILTSTHKRYTICSVNVSNIYGPHHRKIEITHCKSISYNGFFFLKNHFVLNFVPNKGSFHNNPEFVELWKDVQVVYDTTKTQWCIECNNEMLFWGLSLERSTGVSLLRRNGVNLLWSSGGCLSGSSSYILFLYITLNILMIFTMPPNGPQICDGRAFHHKYSLGEPHFL